MIPLAILLVFGPMLLICVLGACGVWEPGGVVKANVLADGRRATPWVESGAHFTPTCEACEWTVIRSMSGLVRHVRTAPCPAHTLRSVARP